MLAMFRVDSAGFRTVGSLSEWNQHLPMFHLSCCSWTKLNLYSKKQKKNQMYNLVPMASCLSEIGRPGLSIIGHLNVNSIRNKFEMVSMSVAQYVDILVLSETKLDSTFPSIQFLINGFSVPHRLDWNSKGGGIWSYEREKVIVLPLNRYSLFWIKSKELTMACMLFIQSPQKHNQRTFTGIYRKYSVLLSANWRKKNLGRKGRSRKSSW